MVNGSGGLKEIVWMSVFRSMPKARLARLGS